MESEQNEDAKLSSILLMARALNKGYVAEQLYRNAKRELSNLISLVKKGKLPPKLGQTLRKSARSLA